MTHWLTGVHGSGGRCSLRYRGCGLIQGDEKSARIWLLRVITPQLPGLRDEAKAYYIYMYMREIHILWGIPVATACCDKCLATMQSYMASCG